MGWTTFSIPQFGTSVDYPTTVFSISEGNSEIGIGQRFRTSDANALGLDCSPYAPNEFQPPNLEHRIMRYELTDHEWAAIRPMHPSKFLSGCVMVIPP